MVILIPTYRRAHLQRTYHELENSGRKIQLVIRPEERRAYGGYPCVELDPGIVGIAAARDWIVDKFYPHPVVMFDDDLTFARRRTDDPTKFAPMSADDYERMLMDLDTALSGYRHVGMVAREGANRNTEPFLWCTRAMRVLGYQTKVIEDKNLRFAPGGLMCDFHMTLELLKRGYPNCVLNDWCHNQPGSNTMGGCSEERTDAAQTKAAETLAALHPGLVTVVTKTTKTSWGGKERTDVRVAWKKSFGMARVLDRGAGEDTSFKGVVGA